MGRFVFYFLLIMLAEVSRFADGNFFRTSREFREFHLQHQLTHSAPQTQEVPRVGISPTSIRSEQKSPTTSSSVTIFDRTRLVIGGMIEKAGYGLLDLQRNPSLIIEKALQMTADSARGITQTADLFRKRNRKIVPLLLGGAVLTAFLLSACAQSPPLPSKRDVFVPIRTLPSVTPELSYLTPSKLFPNIKPTGRYDIDALRKLREIPQQPLIDQRIGVVHIDPRYPDIGSDAYKYGLDVATRLGIQTFEVEFSVSETSKYHVSVKPESKLADLVENPVLSQIFTQSGIKNIIITAESSNHGDLTQWDISHPDAKFNAETLKSNYDEFFNFAVKLLEKYGNSDKRIIIQTPNELDWHMLGELPGAETRTGEDAPDYAIAHAIALMDIRIRAIQDANKSHYARNPIRTSVEINRVLDAMDNNKRRAVNAVLPFMRHPPDIVGYSAHDSLLDPAKFQAAIRYIKRLLPDMELSISEFGIPENTSGLTSDEIKILFAKDLKIALDEEDVKLFMIWALIDNACRGPAPSSRQCDGFYIVRPDGSINFGVDPIFGYHR